MTEIKFRQATLNDLPILLEFEQGIVTYERPFDPTLKPDPVHYYDLEALIKSEDAEVVVAILGDKVIGSGYVKIEKSKSYLTHDYHGYIGFMFVKEEHRGRGINQGLTEELLIWAKSRGIEEIKLEVYDENASAVRAYEKAGFTKNLVEMRMGI